MNVINFLKSLISPGWNSSRAYSKLNLLTTFSSFKPHGNQPYKAFEPLVIKNINEIIPRLSNLAEVDNKVEIVELSDFVQQNKHKNSDEIYKKLNENFSIFKSDKSKNQYDLIYSVIFPDLVTNFKILEIGMGTNNPEIVSSMGINGKPGASLKAFKNTFQNSIIYGADIDPTILFEEDRIKTFNVDQNNLDTFSNLSNVINSFDYIIDDGLHYQLSNINTLLFSIEKLATGGFLIVEDIGSWTIDTWIVISKLIPDGFKSNLIKMSSNNFVFLLRRIN